MEITHCYLHKPVSVSVLWISSVCLPLFKWTQSNRMCLYPDSKPPMKCNESILYHFLFFTLLCRSMQFWKPALCDITEGPDSSLVHSQASVQPSGCLVFVAFWIYWSSNKTSASKSLHMKPHWCDVYMACVHTSSTSQQQGLHISIPYYYYNQHGNEAGKEHLAPWIRLEMCDCVTQPWAGVAGPPSVWLVWNEKHTLL